jgi:hypothetical protein
MSSQHPDANRRRVFKAKMWTDVALAAMFGPMTLFALILGPLFLFGVLKDAQGAPAVDAGVGLLASLILFLPMSAIAAYQIYAKRQPVLELDSVGFLYRVAGSHPDSRWYRFLPSLFQMIWIVLSGRAFVRQVIAVPWHCVDDVWISGLPMMRKLSIHSHIVCIHEGSQTIPYLVTIPDELREDLTTVRDEIHRYWRGESESDTAKECTSNGCKSQQTGHQ